VNLLINSDNSLQDTIGIIRELYVKHRYLKLSIKMGKDRSLDQNALSFAWYDQLARELREDNVQGWRAYCKLHHGIPILRNDDEEFRAFYDKVLKGMDYETKLTAMEYVPVTSIMTKSQLSRYLEEVQKDFQKRGVMLEFPDTGC